jgi:hypothetical protein
MDFDAPCPITGPPIRVSARSDDTGDDVSSPRNLDFIGLTRLNGSDESREVRFGFVHVHSHPTTLARLANVVNLPGDQTGLRGG